MKWTPYEVNSSGNPIYLDYDNREYFSYNGYGHNHTLLPNTEGGCAIGIGNVDSKMLMLPLHGVLCLIIFIPKKKLMRI